MLARHIERSKKPITQLIAGHRGCGKSTELLRLVDRLKNENYFVLYFEADGFLDINDVKYTDVLVVIVRRLVEGLAQEGIKLDDKLLDDILMWFADTVYQMEDKNTIETMLGSEISAGIEIPLILKLLIKVTGQIKDSSETKESVRLKLDPQVSQLIARVNLLIQDAIVKIRKHGKKDLVIIIDNLDRISLKRIPNRPGITSHDELFIEHSEQLQSLDCHVIYTLPISMLYSSRATALTGSFPNYSILPMIKTHERDGSRCGEGIEALKRVVESRVEASVFFRDDVVEYAAEMSGGMIRDFIRLFRYMFDFVDENDLPIEKSVAERAVNKLINEYNRMIPESHFGLLAAVHRDKDIQNDDKHQLMLYNLSVLEYFNGPTSWFDVHPVVEKLPKFKAAEEELDSGKE